MIDVWSLKDGIRNMLDLIEEKIKESFEMVRAHKKKIKNNTQINY